MPAPNRSNKTRVDYHTEQRERIRQELEEEDPDTDFGDYLGKESAEKAVAREDELIWSHHRDPETDLTQVQARDRAQHTDYPERYNVSQSSISRKLSRLDDDMLTEPVERLRMREREHPEELAGFLGPMELKNFKRHGFDDLLRCYRDTLARLLVDMEALDLFSSGEELTPEWARERFPDLDPDVGRRYYKRSGIGEGTTLHPPTEEVEPASPSTADD